MRSEEFSGTGWEKTGERGRERVGAEWGRCDIGNYAL